MRQRKRDREIQKREKERENKITFKPSLRPLKQLAKTLDIKFIHRKNKLPKIVYVCHYIFKICLIYHENKFYFILVKHLLNV